MTRFKQALEKAAKLAESLPEWKKREYQQIDNLGKLKENRRSMLESCKIANIPELKFFESFDKMNITLDILLRLRGFDPGTVLEVEYTDDPGNTYWIVIGNCTPYIQITSCDGGIGWSYDQYSNIRVLNIYKLIFQFGSLITPR